MGETEICEKLCKNCKYFVLHYCNTKGTFKRLSVGHCTLDYRKKRLLCDCSCDKWENNEEAIQKRHEKIENTLRDMAKDVNHIVQILEDEKRL